jgi:hypothetical protein
MATIAGLTESVNAAADSDARDRAYVALVPRAGTDCATDRAQHQRPRS